MRISAMFSAEVFIVHLCLISRRRLCSLFPVIVKTPVGSVFSIASKTVISNFLGENFILKS